MSKPIDAYREGYLKGKQDNIAGNVAESLMGLLRDDPGGFYAAGYRDGGGGKSFNPPSVVEKKQTGKPAASAPLSDLEKSWYGLCDGSDFISQEIAAWYIARLNEAGKTVQMVIGLHNFTGTACPKCSSEGQFKIHFLGKLNHPGCRTWYMGSFSYIGFQLSQVLHSGIRAAGSIKEDCDRKGDRTSGWMQGIFGFLFTAVFRAMLAMVLIPLHVLVAIFQPHQSRNEIIVRLTALAVVAGALSVGFYELQAASHNGSPLLR